MPHAPSRQRARALVFSLLCAGCAGVIEDPSTGRSVDPASAANEDAAGATGTDNQGGAGEPGATGNGGPNANDPNDSAANNGDGSATGGDQAPGTSDNGDEPTPAVDVPANGLALREIAVYQGVKITIARGASDVIDRNANVVAGRPGLLRVFVDPDTSFAARSIVAKLTLTNPGATPIELTSTLTVSGASRDEVRDSTFNFDLTGEQLTTSTEFSVALLEAQGAADTGPASAAVNRMPETGVSALGARSAGGPFKVVVVPVRYQADGSGRTPSFDAAEIQDMRARLFALLPTSDIEVTVSEPIDFNGAILADGTGWSELLNQCLANRSERESDAKTYHYCMFDPAPDFGQYCGRGCVAGLGPVPRAGDTFSRAAIGLGFGDAVGTMAHELGHTLGRPHAPCGGVAGPDPGYPYAGGVIGAWGYDLVSKQLLAPNEHTDLMGYCDKAWISDYNYNLVFERFQSVLSAPQLRREPTDLLSIVVDADQSLHLGSALTLVSVPDGESVRVDYFDAAGAQLGASATGTFVAVSHLTGGIVYIPAPPAGAAHARLAGFGDIAL